MSLRVVSHEVPLPCLFFSWLNSFLFCYKILIEMKIGVGTDLEIIDILSHPTPIQKLGLQLQGF